MKFFKEADLIRESNESVEWKEFVDKKGKVVLARRIEGPFCVAYRSQDLYCSNGFLVVDKDMAYPVVFDLFESNYSLSK